MACCKFLFQLQRVMRNTGRVLGFTVCCYVPSCFGWWFCCFSGPHNKNSLKLIVYLILLILTLYLPYIPVHVVNKMMTFYLSNTKKYSIIIRNKPPPPPIVKPKLLVCWLFCIVYIVNRHATLHLIRAQFHGSAYVSVLHLLAENLCLCKCIFHVTRHYSLTQLAQTIWVLHRLGKEWWP